MAKQQKGSGVGCLILFALPFAAVGVGSLGLSVWDVHDWLAAKSWVERPARILELELVSSSSDDGTSYEVEARYQYDFEGRAYESERVAISRFSDNIGSFQEDLYAQLAPPYRTQKLVSCWVDPDDPRRALLDRRLRWGLLAFQGLFAVLFGGVGFGMLFGGWFGKKKLEEEKQLGVLYPDEPWKHRPDWAVGRIPFKSRTSWMVPTGFALFWNLISSPVLFFVPRELERENWLALLGLIFPLVGIYLAYLAVRAGLRVRKFGGSELVLTTVPGVLGGLIKGHLHVGAMLEAPEGCQLTLSCVRSRTKSNNERENRDDILWQDAYTVRPQELLLSATGSVVPFRFVLPHDGKPTRLNRDSENDRVEWRLTAEATVPGVDYAVRFEVPVFHTEASSADFEDKGIAAERRATSWASTEKLETLGVTIESLPSGGKRFVARRNRTPEIAVPTTLFLLLWLGVTCLLVYLGVGLFFEVLFGLFGLILLGLSFETWLGGSTVEASPNGLGVAHSWLGSGKRRTLAVGEIESFRAAPGWRVGERLFYRVMVRSVAGDERVVFKRIASLRTAQQLMEEVEEGLRG